MNAIKLKPEKEQKTLWIISWIVTFIIGILICIGLSITVHFVAFMITALGWIVIMIPILIWIPAAFRRLEYYIDDDGVKMEGGLVWKKYVTVPYPKITNIDTTQGPLQRKYNIVTIHVQTAGSGGKQGEKAELRMYGIRDFKRVRKVIIEKVRNLSYYSGREVKPGVEDIQVDKISIFKDMLKELKEIKGLLQKK